MQIGAVTLTTLFIVSSTCLHVALGNTRYRNVVRKKREQDSHIGKLIPLPPPPDYDANIRHTTQRPKTQNQSDASNPCLKPLKLIKPDLNVPGRRISEIQCYNYMWEVKKRHEYEKKEFECESYRREKGEYDYLSPEVVGGRDAYPGEFPHMGAVGWKAAVGTWIFKCGSSLISPKFMLTAAHCSRVSSADTSVADPEPKIVRLGDRNIMDIPDINNVEPTDVKIVKFIAHHNYKSPKKYNDIALIELEKTIIFTRAIQPACLWIHSNTSSLGPKATVTGWGVIETVGRKTSPTLQVAEVDVIDTERCNNLLRYMCNRNWCGIQNQVCAGNLTGGVDACQGDSGGPLQVKIPLPITTQGSMHYMIGVTSFGHGCARKNSPGVYTRVSNYIDWIESIVWK